MMDPLNSGQTIHDLMKHTFGAKLQILGGVSAEDLTS